MENNSSNVTEPLIPPTDEAAFGGRIDTEDPLSAEHSHVMAEIDQLDLPECVVKKARECFVKNPLPGEHTSMADYCGPCHMLARRACFVLVLSEVVGLLLGWLLPAAEVLGILLVLQLFNAMVLYLQWESLKYILLPWQHTLWRNGSTNFRLPLISSLFKTGFDEWKFGISIVSLVVVLSLQNQAVLVGKVIRHGMDVYHKCISGSCFLATFVSLGWVIIWSQPVCRDVRWDFDRDRNNKPGEEIQYKTIAYHMGFTQGKATHYEALMRYAHFAGMFGVQQMTNSVQEAEASLLWYAAEDFERKCIVRIQMVMRFDFAMVFCRVFLRTVPQVCLATWQYHNSWESWWGLGPLVVSLAVFILSDCSTFITAEGIYGEFTSQLLADRDESDDFRERSHMMTSSRRYHLLRLLTMVVSVFLILSCLCMVLADWICQPFLVSDGTCRLHQEQNKAILLVLCFMVFFIVIVGVSFWFSLRPLPLWEPCARKNSMKLYVDEDAAEYYWHVPNAIDVTMIRDGRKKFQHIGAHETRGTMLKVETGEDRPFKDNKLLRVQERGQQGDIQTFTRQRKEFLLKRATKDDWFELALRFSKELTPYQWAEEVRKFPERRMVKLLGFDGGHPMVSSYVNDATDELLDADVVLWDGDWFCMQGWTGMIHTFLKAKKDAKAVAFQKRAEVPGFHRSYWKLYQQFPNRIRVVVLKDAGYVCPQPILDRHAWLEKQFETNRLEKPYRAEDDTDKYNKYVTVALVGRKFQGETSVIAMNGGVIATALAALETGDSPFRKIRWTVYEAWKVKRDKKKTLLDYALLNSNSNPYLKVVRQEEKEDGNSSSPVGGDFGREQMGEVIVAGSGGCG